MLMRRLVPHSELASARFDTLQHALAPGKTRNPSRNAASASGDCAYRMRISSTFSNKVGEQAEGHVT